MAELARCYDGELEVYEYAAFLNGRLIFSEPEVVAIGLHMARSLR